MQWCSSSRNLLLFGIVSSVAAKSLFQLFSLLLWVRVASQSRYTLPKLLHHPQNDATAKRERGLSESVFFSHPLLVCRILLSPHFPHNRNKSRYEI